MKKVLGSLFALYVSTVGAVAGTVGIEIGFLSDTLSEYRFRFYGFDSTIGGIDLQPVLSFDFDGEYGTYSGIDASFATENKFRVDVDQGIVVPTEFKISFPDVDIVGENGSRLLSMHIFRDALSNLRAGWFEATSGFPTFENVVSYEGTIDAGGRRFVRPDPTLSTVPLPSGLLLAMSGLIGLIAFRSSAKRPRA